MNVRWPPLSSFNSAGYLYCFRASAWRDHWDISTCHIGGFELCRHRYRYRYFPVHAMALEA